MKIGVLTSGGDAPGMNAAVRTIAMVGAARGHEVVGIARGYEGLLDGETRPLDLQAVDGISRLGGTVLGSARSARFPTEEGQALARRRVGEIGLEALVVIGGNGSLAGAHRLAEGRPCRVVGLPASIDNDVGHTGLSIGVDTAVNTIVEACDRISDTARAHRRAFVVEVMGRNCGFLAMRAGIAAEADAILYREGTEESEDALVERVFGILAKCFRPGRGKTRALILKSEGVRIPTPVIVRRLQERLDRDLASSELGGVDVRETVLGHVVRGGNPSALDRVMAQRLAFGAVIACEKGAHDVMLGWDVPDGFGAETADPHVRVVPIHDVLEESAALGDASSPVVKRRLELLQRVQDILSL
jgi:6-phosphofructokinase 1